MVAQGIAEEVEAEDGAGNGDGGEEDEVRGVEEVERASLSMASPTWRGSGDAEAEKRESGFGEDDAGHADGCLDEDRLEDVGQDVAEEDAQAAGTERAGGIDIFSIAHGHDLRADEARIAGPSADGEGEHEVGESGSEKSGEGDGEQDAGEGEEGVHGEGGEGGIDPAAEIAGEAAERDVRAREKLRRR